MTIALTLFREISVRVSQGDAVILNSLWGDWRCWYDAGDELRALGGEDDPGVVRQSVNLAEIREAVLARQMKERATCAVPMVPKESE